MGEEKYRDPFMAVSAIVIALVAMGVVIFTKVPLKGLRPVTELREPSEQVQARLWQDPFTAVLDYIHSRPKGISFPEPDLCPLFSNQSLQIQESVKKGALPQEIATLAKGKGKITILGAMVFGSPYAEENRIPDTSAGGGVIGFGAVGLCPRRCRTSQIPPA